MLVYQRVAGWWFQTWLIYPRLYVEYPWISPMTGCWFPIILEMSSSQLTTSMIFQRGRLNHQPEKWAFRGISRGFQCDLTNANMVIYSIGMSWDQNPTKNVTVWWDSPEHAVFYLGCHGMSWDFMVFYHYPNAPYGIWIPTFTPKMAQMWGNMPAPWSIWVMVI